MAKNKTKNRAAALARAMNKSKQGTPPAQPQSQDVSYFDLEESPAPPDPYANPDPNEVTDHVPDHTVDFIPEDGVPGLLPPVEENNVGAPAGPVRSETLYVSSVLSVEPAGSDHTTLVFENVYGETLQATIRGLGPSKVVRDFEVVKVNRVSLIDLVFQWLDLDDETGTLRPMSPEDWNMKLGYVCFPAIESLARDAFEGHVAIDFFMGENGVAAKADMTSRESVLQHILSLMDDDGLPLPGVRDVVHVVSRNTIDCIALTLIL